MKISLSTEKAMLISVVLPTIQQLRKLIEQGEEEEAQRLAARDVVGLLTPYRNSENEKYNNAPSNLKSAPQFEQMKTNVELLNDAIAFFYDEAEKACRPTANWDLDAVEQLVTKIIE